MADSVHHKLIICTRFVEFCGRCTSWRTVGVKASLSLIQTFRINVTHRCSVMAGVNTTRLYYSSVHLLWIYNYFCYCYDYYDYDCDDDDDDDDDYYYYYYYY